MSDENTEPVEILTDEDFGDFKFGPKMLALNRRERKFVYGYASNLARTPPEAARMAGYIGDRIAAWRLLQRDDITEAIMEVCRQGFPRFLPRALEAVERILKTPKHPAHAKVALSVLSRLGFGEKDAVDVRVSGEVVVNHVEAAVDDLRRAKELGFSRETLLKMFGNVGLDRYEQMLKAREPKLIEHNDG